ncbi:MAG: helix-turn-helix transcriptional regulator [bacterium]|nr:helix-turn-helix transcriptional regulator [bacterium]
MARPRRTKEERARGEELGKEIQRKRQASRRSSAEIAVDAGMSIDTLRGLEQGRVADPGVFVIAAIASALGCGVDELVSTANRNSE